MGRRIRSRGSGGPGSRARQRQRGAAFDTTQSALRTVSTRASTGALPAPRLMLSPQALRPKTAISRRHCRSTGPNAGRNFGPAASRIPMSHAREWRPSCTGVTASTGKAPSATDAGEDIIILTPRRALPVGKNPNPARRTRDWVPGAFVASHSGRDTMVAAARGGIGVHKQARVA